LNNEIANASNLLSDINNSCEDKQELVKITSEISRLVALVSRFNRHSIENL